MNYTAKDISRMLASRVEQVVRHLLPHGKQTGGDWCTGSVDGEKGGSLKVCLRGDKAGVWADFAGGAADRGDLLDLWKCVRRLPLRDAFIEASKWLGVWHETAVERKTSYLKPSKAGLNKLKNDAGAGTAILAYLLQERKLVSSAVEAYKVAQKDGHIVLPYFSPGGELLNLKHLELKRDDRGKKVTWLEKGCALPLWGWQAIPEGATELLISEGEFDAMSWSQFGFPALSVPNGCKNTDWVDFDWDALAPLDTIYLSYDMDDEGKAGAKRVAERLGLHRCRIVSLPHKDANECLQKGCTSKDALRWIAAAKPITPPEICDPTFFRNEVQEFFYPTGLKPRGFVSGLLGLDMAFRPGEITLFTGVSSHGKSVFWSHLMIEAASEGYRAAVASLEIPPAVTLAIMAKQWTGEEKPSAEKLDAFLSILSGRLWVFDIFGIAEREKLLALCEYSRARYAVDFIVIDSLMKLKVSGEDYEGQRLFINDLAGFAQKTRCHVFLVAHPRKLASEAVKIGKLDVKGSSDIFNQADNVLALWRNREKEERNQGKENESPSKDPDTLVCVEKQRLTGMEFRKPLWFLPHCKQFKLNDNASPSIYALQDAMLLP